MSGEPLGRTYKPVSPEQAQPKEEAPPERPASLARYYALFKGRQKFPAPLPRNREYYYGLFEAFGKEMVLERISSGELPMTIALDHDWPVSYFLDWVETHIHVDDYKKALDRCAQAHVLKAQLVLTPVLKKDEMQQAKALAEQNRWVAERLDPNQWSGTRKVEPPVASLSIVFQGMPDPLTLHDNKTKVIEGEVKSSAPSPAPPFELVKAGPETEKE